MPSTAMPTEIALAIVSSPTDASTSGSAAGFRNVVMSCQSPWICSQPATSAPAASTVTTNIIENGPSPWPVWMCSRAYADGSPPKTRKMSRNV